MKASPARPVTDWLEAEDSWRALAARADRLIALQTVVARHFPGTPLTVASLVDGTLTLRAPNAAWVARLRQSIPSMLRRLQVQAPDIVQIRIAGQRLREDRRAAVLRVPRAAIPDTALRELSRLEAEDTGTPALNSALARLVARHRRRS